MKLNKNLNMIIIFKKFIKYKRFNNIDNFNIFNISVKKKFQNLLTDCTPIMYAVTRICTFRQ